GARGSERTGRGGPGLGLPRVRGDRLGRIVRVEGLEPPRAEAHQDLNLARIANSATPARERRIRRRDRNGGRGTRRPAASTTPLKRVSPEVLALPATEKGR